MPATFLGLLSLHWYGNIGFGDAVVGVGTLLLAIFTFFLAKSTKKSVKAGEASVKAAEKSAESSDAAVKAALEGIAVDRDGVKAMQDQVAAMSVPYVVPVPDPQHRTDAPRENLRFERPIHRAIFGTGHVLRFRLLNVGSGPAIVTAVQFVEPGGNSLLHRLGEAYPITGPGFVDVGLATDAHVWPRDPVDLTYSIEYAAADGREFRTDGAARVDGQDNGDIHCSTFRRTDQ